LDIRNKYGEILAEHLESLVEEIKYIGEEYGLSLDFLTEDKNNKDSKTQTAARSHPNQ
jgi:hypothetical protein